MTQPSHAIFIISESRETGLMAEILSNEGYRLFHAAPHDDVLAWGNRDAPDLILVDMDGSARRGIDLCRSLTAAPWVGLIPVVLTAPLPDLQDKEDAFNAGCSDFITKPFSFAEVRARIRNCLLSRNNIKLLEEVVDGQTEQLRLSEARFRDIFTRLSIGAVIFQAVEEGNDFLVVDFNPAAEQMEKVHRQDVVGRRVTEVFPGIAELGLLSVLKRVWETGKMESLPAGFYRDGRMEGWRANHVFKLFTGEVISVYRDVTEEKKAEREISRSRDFLQNVIDGVQDGLRVMNRDGSIAFANKAALDRVDGRDLQLPEIRESFFHTAAGRRGGLDYATLLETVLNTGQLRTAEKVVKDATGRERVYELSLFPVSDEPGKVLQAIELSRDVTVRKQWEDLKKVQMRLTGLSFEYPSKQLLQAFLDEIEKEMHSRMAFFQFIRKDQTMVRRSVWSAGTLKSIGQIQGDVQASLVELAEGWAEACARTHQPVVDNAFGRDDQRNGGPDDRSPLIRVLVVPVVRNGRVEATLGVGYREYDYSETEVGIVQALADMAWDSYARKLAEEELQSSEARFSKMFMSSPDATCLIGHPDGCILDLNASFEEMFGYPKSKVAGKECLELRLWEKNSFIRGIYRRLKKSEPVRDIEGTARRASGELFEVSVSADSIAMEENIFFIVIIRDISGRKASERERKTLEAQLQQARKLEAVGTMAGGIAHDFNNILSAIIGYTQLAMTGVQEDEKTCDRLQQILTAGGRAKDLVSQILLFCRQETREVKPLKVQIIVKEALKFLRSSLPSTIRIKQSIEEETEKVMADPTQIHQVIMNICTNAYQAMKQTGGVLDVSLKQVELTPGNVSERLFLKPGQYLRLKVSDTGAGIPEEMRDRVFEPYYTTKEKGEGTGLGLAVVHGIVTGLGGEVTLESRRGMGACFGVYLPVLPGRQKTLPEKSVPEAPGGSERLLFVDDETALTEMHRTLLSNAGYRVTAVTDGLEALALFRKTPDAFDLVITDMTMPEMTGDVLAEKILEMRPEIPIIIVTGYSERMNPEQAAAKGIQGYLEKPFLQRHLAAKIRELLDKRK